MQVCPHWPRCLEHITHRYTATTWKDPAIPAMMVVGGVVALPAFIYWETKRAKFPIVPFRLLGNRTVLSACIVNFFDFVSFYLTVSSCLSQKI